MQTQTDKGQLYQRRRVEDDAKLDAELEALEKATQETPPTEETVKPDPNASVEEKTYAKRYADLRRFNEQKTKEYQSKIEALEKEKELLRQANTTELPRTKEEVEKWRNEFPDAYAIVRTIAGMEAEEKNQSVVAKMAQIEEKEKKLAYNEAMSNLLAKHPDANELRNSEEFHNWASNQTKEIQSWLYDNQDDWVKAARAIDLYKFDKGVTKSAAKQEKVDASKSVTAKTAVEPKDDKKKTWKRSEIAKLSDKKFEEMEDELNSAYLEGRITND